MKFKRSQLLTNELKLKGSQTLRLSIVLMTILFVNWEIAPYILKPLNGSFYQNSILITNYLVINKLSLLFGLGIIIFSIIFNFGRLTIKWDMIPKQIRWIILTCVMVLFWAYGITETNYFYNENYLLDKLIFLALTILVFFRPAFTLLFLLQAYILSKQFAYALPIEYTYTDKQIIFDILFSFSLYLGLSKLRFLRVQWQYFFIVLMLIVCNWYFKAGIGKFLIEWTDFNNNYFLFSAATNHDWLLNYSQLKLFLVNLLEDYFGLIQVLTLVVEIVFPLIFFFNRNLSKVIIISFIGFHLMVFLTSGIFFWKWILLEIAILFAIHKGGMDKLFVRKYVVVVYCSFLILSYFFSPAPKLAWLNTPLLQKFNFYLVYEDGEKQKLDPSFFSPYDVIFSQGRFYFMYDREFYVGTYGSTRSLENYSRIEKAVNNKDLSILKGTGEVFFDSLKYSKVVSFVQTFIPNKVKGDVKWINRFDVPMHIIQGRNQQNFEFQSRVVALEVEYQDLILSENLDVDNVSSGQILIPIDIGQR